MIISHDFAGAHWNSSVLNGMQNPTADGYMSMKQKKNSHIHK